MLAGAGPSEGPWHANNVSVGALKFFGKIDLVACRVLKQAVYGGDLISNFDKHSWCRVEASRRDGGSSNSGETGYGAKHREAILCSRKCERRLVISSAQVSAIEAFRKGREEEDN